MAVIIAEFIALSGRLEQWEAGLGFATAFLMMASTMSMNDIFDREIDAINAPMRPIPSGQVGLLGASIVSAVLLVLSLTLSAAIDIESFGVALLAALLMMYYNIRGKRTGLLGNMIVSICVSLPFVFGGFTVRSFHPNLIIFTILAFLSNLGREIVKGIADMRGDMAKNVRTVAVMYGPRKAAVSASLCIAFAVFASIIPLILGTVSSFYAIPLLFSCVGFMLTARSILRDQSEHNAVTSKNRLLAWMFLGLVAFLAGNIKLA